MPLALSDLLCAEDAEVLSSGDPAEHHTVSSSFAADNNIHSFPDDSDESIAEFLGGAADFSPGFDYSERFRSRVLDPSDREESVEWILKVRDYYSFQPLTAYLAVNYLDRFLATHLLPGIHFTRAISGLQSTTTMRCTPIYCSGEISPLWREAKGWELQLLAVACISIAAKMEETLVPSLLDLQIEGARFLFEPRTICKMELLVLTSLKWKLRSVTPFTFIDFFSYKVDPTGIYSRYLVFRATKIIIATMHDIDFLDHCPSSMAAAAVICAVEETPGIALVDSESAMAWCIGLTKEGIGICYRLMQEVVIGNKQRKPVPILPQLRLTVDNLSSETSSSSHSPNKRRKLNNHLWVENDREGI